MKKRLDVRKITEQLQLYTYKGGVHGMEERISKYLYALEKLAARESFIEFLENWGISDEEYERDIKPYFLALGIKGYITR